MSRYWLIVLGLVFGISGLAYAAPQSLDDADLRQVSGGQGITFQMEMFMNATRDNSNAADPANTAANGAVPLSTLSNCAGTSSPCTFAIQYANRNGNAADCTVNNVACVGNQNGQWIVMHNVFMGIRIFELDLDGGSLASASSSSAYWDHTKFENPTGGCLLNVTFGIASTTACPSSLTAGNLTAMNGLNAMIFNMATLGATSLTAGAPGTAEKSTGYNSLSLGLNIGRMAMEYGTGTSNNGYSQDSGKSFLGLVIADTWSDNQSQNRGATLATTGACTTGAASTCVIPTYANVLSLAGVAITGKVYVFGY